ncbi:MarR family winged helix-turn-helix transcriptional regulator [Pseudonocardia acidicola]|uniref:MarR family transcriptional regulator n=1 Tax=Pseudonocardia acidicola TaxID=2724939 RepID=A0ABX1SCB1_9PSEU|nr:MarR family transcriptional regulator [Pseudonocardia acidicola]NMH98133.1 MarR family transcriptional regulator [Pseudonocardia acidicola]
MPDRPDPVGVTSVTVAGHSDSLPVLEREVTVLIRRSMESLWSAGYGEHPEVDRYTYPVMVLLDEHGPQRLTVLTRRLGHSKPTVSRQVSRLSRAGLVATRPDERDPRSVVVRLTRAGAARVEAVRQARLAPLREVLAAWPEEDRDALAVLLSRFNADLAGYRATE